MAMTFYNMKVANSRKSTKNAVIIEFLIKADQRDMMSFKPGQYLTISHSVNGEELRRAYSICSSTHHSNLSILVKRLKGGKMSNYLNDNITIGDTLKVLAPQGNFVRLPEHHISKCYYFFAAGSGITPIISMIASTLEDEPLSKCYLLYGSKCEDEILLKPELDNLQEKYLGQLKIAYTLSQAKQSKPKGIKGLFKKATIDWDGLQGRISVEMITEFINEHDCSKEKEYFICGPSEMIETTKSSLLSMEIDKKSINQEYFTSADLTKATTNNAKAGGEKKVKVLLEGKIHHIVVKDNITILQTLIDNGIEAPYSCSSGACATCMAKVNSGKVSMDECFALDDDEIDDGFILSCQAHPVSEDLDITFDV